MAKPRAPKVVTPLATLAGGPSMAVWPAVQCAVVSRDGATLHTGHFDGTLRAWDARTGAHTATWTTPRETRAVASLALASGGAQLVAAVGRGVVVRDLPRGTLRATLTSFAGDALSLGVLPDGDGLVVGASDGAATVLSLDGAVRATAQHGDAVTTLAVSPAGGELATAGGAVRAIRRWGLDGSARGELGASRPHAPTRLAYAPDGRTLYAGYIAFPGAGASVVAWDLARAAPRWERAIDDNPCDLHVVDDGRRLITAHSLGALCVWDADSGTVVHRVACRSIDGDPRCAPSCVAPGPDGALFVALIYRRIARMRRDGAVLSLDDPPPWRMHEGPVRALAFDGERAVVSLGAAGDLARWDLRGVDPPARVAAAKHRPAAPEAAPECARDGGVTLALSDGLRALAATTAAVHVVERATGVTLASLTGLPRAASCLAVSPGARTVAASDGDAIVVWKLPK